MEQTTITVDEPTLRRFKQLKEELDEQQQDVPNHTADTFLHALMDTWEAADDGYYSEPSADEIAEQLKQDLEMIQDTRDDVQELEPIVERLERLEETVKEATDAAQRAERKVEQLK